MTMKCCECGSEMLWDEAINGYACLVCCSSVVVLGAYRAARGRRVTEALRQAEYLEGLARKRAQICSCGESVWMK